MIIPYIVSVLHAGVSSVVARGTTSVPREIPKITSDACLSDVNTFPWTVRSFENAEIVDQLVEVKVMFAKRCNNPCPTDLICIVSFPSTSLLRERYQNIILDSA